VSGVCQAFVRHVLSAEHHRIVYIQETESFLRCGILSPPFIHVSYSKGGRVTPSLQAYFHSPLKIGSEAGGHRLILPVSHGRHIFHKGRYQ
jgi:hypothetical protein